MTRTRKNFRHNSLVGGSNNAGAAGPAEEAGASAIGDNEPDPEFMKGFNKLNDIRHGLIFNHIGCVGSNEVDDTKCLFEFMLKNEEGILSKILFMVKLVNTKGIPKSDKLTTDFKEYLKTFIDTKNPIVSHINKEITIQQEPHPSLNKQIQDFTNKLNNEVIKNVNYLLPKNSIKLLSSLQTIIFPTDTPKKYSRVSMKSLMQVFSKKSKQKIYFNPMIANLIAKKFFIRIKDFKKNVVDEKGKIIRSKKNDIFNYIVISLELTLKDFFKCGSGTEPQVDALLHELQSEVALLQMQETAEQAQLATLQQRLEEAKADIAEAEARKVREAAEGEAQLYRRLAKHKIGEAGTKRKGSRAEGMNKKSMKKKRRSGKGSSKKKKGTPKTSEKGKKGSIKKKPTKKKGSKKK